MAAGRLLVRDFLGLYEGSIKGKGCIMKDFCAGGLEAVQNASRRCAVFGLSVSGVGLGI